MFLGAVTLLCVSLTLVNLVLTLGVIRRLREHSEKFTALAKSAPRPEPMIGPGKRPAPFSATAVDGTLVSHRDLTEGSLVAFFSPTCDSCAEWLPRFVEAAAALPRGQRQALAVVIASEHLSNSEMVAKLRPVATVVVEGEKGPIAEAFEVTGYPAMGRLDENGAVLTHRPADVLSLPVGA